MTNTDQDTDLEFPHTAGFVRALPALGGLGSIALGIVVLVGWGLSIPRVVQVLPGLTPMQANTAVCFILLGAGLLCLRRRRGVAALVLGIATVLIASAVLSQYLFHLELGIDQLLLRQALPTLPSPHPGRMAPNTAVAFVMAGLALALLVSRRLSFGGALLGCLVFTLGFIALAGFPAGIGRALALGATNQMALHTSVGLVLASAGLVAEGFARRPRGEAVGARRGALLAGVTAALIGLLFWQSLRLREEQQILQFVGQATDGMQQDLNQRMDATVSALQWLSRRVGRPWSGSARRWKTDAEFTVGVLREIDAVEWLDDRYRPRLVATEEEDAPPPASGPVELGKLELRALERAAETLQPVVIGPVPTPGREAAIQAIVPVEVREKAAGFVVATLSVTETLDNLWRNLATGYEIRVRCEGRDVYRSPGFTPEIEEPAAQQRALTLPGGLDWTLEVRPELRLAEQLRTPLPEIALVTGLLLAALIGATIWFGESASLRARHFETAVAERTAELERAMGSLRTENEQRRRGEAILERTLAVSRLVSAESDLPRIVQAVTDAVTELTGARYGAFFYNVAGPGSETYMLYALSGASRDLFADYPTPRKTELFAPTFDGTGVVRCDDVRTDPRYGLNPPHEGLPGDHPLAVVSYMAVPVVSRTGKVWGGLLCGHPEPGVFTERDEQLAQGVASNAATAMDKADALTSERQARDEAQSANAAKDRFLAVVSHELRNPLGSIHSALEVLGRGPTEPAAEARMRGILERQVKQLARLVDDLLDVSRMTQGLVKLELKRLDVVALVRHIVHASRAKMESADLKLIGLFPDEPVWVDADAARITQAMDNMLTNARKFTDPGGRVEVAVREHGHEVEIAIRDDGCGLEANELESVFEPFEQVGRNLADGSGLGLGLAIVKGLVEAHGGTVKVESPGAGRGCTFSMRLAIQDAPVSEPAAETSAATVRRRVLLIDDHEDSLEGLRELLSVLGHEVRVATRGREGLELARSDPPEIVICDIGLPEMDGYDVARAMRDHPATAGLCLVALSGFGDEASVARAHEAGFDHHLTKPVDLTTLRELLAEATPEES